MSDDSRMGPTGLSGQASPSPTELAKLESFMKKYGIDSEEARQAFRHFVGALDEAKPSPTLVFRAKVIDALTKNKGGLFTDELAAVAGADIGFPEDTFGARKELYAMATDGLLSCAPFYHTNRWTLRDLSTMPPQKGTDGPLAQKILAALARRPQHVDELMEGELAHEKGVLEATERLVAERLIEPVFPTPHPIDTARIVYRVKGDADQRLAVLEAENASLRARDSETSKLLDAERERSRRLERDVKENRDGWSRASKDRSDTQKALEEERAKTRANAAAEDELRATIVEQKEMIASRDRQLDLARETIASLQKDIAERAEINKALGAKDAATITDLQREVKSLRRACAPSRMEVLVLGPRMHVILQCPPGGKPFVRSTTYPTVDSALAWMAQNDTTVNILCRLVPSGTPSVPLSLLNELVSALRGNAPINAMALADALDAALAQGIQKELAST